MASGKTTIVCASRSIWVTVTVALVQPAALTVKPATSLVASASSSEAMTTSCGTFQSLVVKVNTAQGFRDATVLKVGKFNVDLDTNHPLAGKDLIFDVEMVEIV